MSAHLRPLQVRPGARFRCFGDGLCCSDIHALGPVTAREQQALAKYHALVGSKRLRVLRNENDGACTFLGARESVGARPCALVGSAEPEARPRTCDRFPFLIMKTPRGARVGTDHRCPCRTMGERPLLDVDDIERSCADVRGHLISDGSVPNRIRIASRRSVSFATYEALEEPRMHNGGVDWLQQLAQRAGVFSSSGFMRIGLELAHQSAPREVELTRNTAAKLWFGLALADLHGARSLGKRDLPRPWSDAFARAARRTATLQASEVMLADFALDALWSMEWSLRGSLQTFEDELAERLRVARHLHAFWTAQGARADAAMAEAIMVVETAGLSEAWQAIFYQG